jgi:NAD(P)-dependent dehydrogenase (short-subunit alcohol dehydrogenase family)
MQVNYFGALRMTMGLMPHMSARRRGHVINISSIGVLTNAPRFSAYVASKAALDAWTACASSEFADVGVKFTTINMPLVRTPMIAPTKLYQNVPTLSPDEAADLIVRAIVYKPVRIATRLGVFGQILHAAAPRIAQIVMNTTFRMFPDSDRAKSEKEGGKGKATRYVIDVWALLEVCGFGWVDEFLRGRGEHTVQSCTVKDAEIARYTRAEIAHCLNDVGTTQFEGWKH